MKDISPVNHQRPCDARHVRIVDTGGLKQHHYLDWGSVIGSGEDVRHCAEELVRYTQLATITGRRHTSGTALRKRISTDTRVAVQVGLGLPIRSILGRNDLVANHRLVDRAYLIGGKELDR